MVKYYLVVEEGMIREKVFPVIGKLAIGREEGSDIELSDPSVSKQHAVVYLVEGQPVVKDLASLNGTFVNAEKITKAGLRGGDTIRVGNTTIRIIEKTERRKKPDTAATQELQRPGLPPDAGDMDEPFPSRRTLEAISGLSLFAGFTPEQLVHLSHKAHLSLVEPGRTIVRHGEAVRVLSIILDGKVRICMYDNQGKEILVSFLGENHAFDEISFLTGLPCTITASAEEETLICDLRYDAVQEIVESSPALKDRLEEYSQELVREWESRKTGAGLAERRRCPRFRMELPVDLSLSPTASVGQRLQGRVLRGLSTDVSRSGMRLKIRDRDLLELPPGLVVQVVISLPGSWGNLRCPGVLRDIAQNEEDPAVVHLGLEFTEAAASQTRVLERFLSEGGGDGISEKVLVVDDEEQIRELLREFLVGAGYEVLVAANGEEAIEVAQRERPHLILLDIRMPELDGVETCVRLKTHEKTRSIPVIIATAFGDTLAEALDAGADDFVSKPFQLEEIGLRIRSLLRVRHLTNELERAAAYIGELHKQRPRL
ncbi:MAG TPA: response regulator [Syntrophobacteria bacterium]|nr:response regulator [Syntrophobacteria bacterium]